MSLEIERKFLVNSDAFKNAAFKKAYIKQGFLNSDKNRVVRVRVKDEQGFLTIKGKTTANGTTRFEWEKEISLSDAKNLFALCEKGIIEKYRYLIKVEGYIYEVDEFLGDNEGLIVAEIELNDEHDSFEKPSWIAQEVTGEIKYYNSNLSKNPYKYWHKKSLN